MNSLCFSQTMQLIDDEFLEEAYAPIKKITKQWITTALIAACVGLVVGMGAWRMTNGLDKTVMIDESAYGLVLELPDSATNVTYQIVDGDTNMPMLEASFYVGEEMYLCRMVNTKEPADLTSMEGMTISMMDWKTSDLSFQYREQEETASWVSWYDNEANTQWCLSGTNPAALLSTAELLVQKLGYSMSVAPDGANKVSYAATSYLDMTIGETGFVWEDVHYTYRMAATMELEVYFKDISDMLVLGNEYETEVLWCPARITIDEYGRGKIVWFDIVPGLLYSLTMDANASEEALLEMAHRLFEPAQESNP